MWRTIVELKAEHPAFRPNELTKICYIRFGRRPSLHSIKRILAAHGMIEPENGCERMERSVTGT